MNISVDGRAGTNVVSGICGGVIEVVGRVVDDGHL